jgi:hypothetical protein
MSTKDSPYYWEWRKVPFEWCVKKITLEEAEKEIEERFNRPIITVEIGDPALRGVTTPLLK